MKKGQTMVIGHNGNKKINEGDIVMAIQANKNVEGYDWMVNFDWSLAKDTQPTDIVATLGRFLGNIEEIFGEKMVTKAIMHYALDMKHIVQTPMGPSLHLRDVGLEFKDWKQAAEDALKEQKRGGGDN